MSTIGAQQPDSGIRVRLLNRGAYQWYLGTIVGLVYQTAEIVYVWTSSETLGLKIGATLLLALFYLGYLAIPPLIWPQSVRARVIVLSVYWLSTFVLVPFLGVFVVWVWTLVIAMIAFCWLPLAPTLALSGVIILTQVGYTWAYGFPDGTAISAFVTITVLLSLLGITRQIVSNHALRDAQATIATLAAAEERARLARDLHDVLGHSLTVVAVKSELAGRLVERDPKRAIAEIADIEQLSRTALADLRAAVSSYREMNLDAELSAARTALEAAGIESRLPADGHAVDEDLRPLFSWALREGVTNVIRHSGAKHCWVVLEPRRLTVRDDGRGTDSSGHIVSARAAGHTGNGLSGLRERAAEAGAVLSAGRETDGFHLSVAKAAT
jgi:two-component system sensor histidine kinase DesK